MTTPLERQLDRLERGVLLHVGITPTDPPEQIRALLAGLGKWDEALHPRGKDGTFIEKLGFLKGMFNWVDDAGNGSDNPLHKGKSKKVGRTKVIGFSSGNGATPDDPWVKVQYDGPDPDLQGKVGYARASELSQAAETKARLDLPSGDVPSGDPLPEDLQARVQKAIEEANGSADPSQMLRDRVNGIDKRTAEIDSGQALKDRMAAYDAKVADRKAKRNLADSGLLPPPPLGGDTPALSPADQAMEDRTRALEGVHPDDQAKMDALRFRVSGGKGRPTMEITPRDVQDIYDGGGDVQTVTSVDEALAALADGKKVDLNMPEQVSVLLDRMVEIVNEARTSGKDAPNYNLCEVTIQAISVFCAEHKGIPRIKMPQLMGHPVPGTPAADMTPDERGNVDLNGAFRKMLEDRGVSISDQTMPSSHLKASQNELNGPKVGGIANAMEDGSFDPGADGLRLFVSNDDYIVDGHHRWAANIATSYKGGDDPPMDVAKVNMGIIELLAEANRFADEQGIAQASAANVPAPKATIDAPSAPDAPNAPNAPDGAKPPKVYDRTAADYGLNYQAKYVDDPGLAAARASDLWSSLPVESVDPKTLVAVEDSLRSGPIDKVVSGDVPLREGYVAKVFRKKDGTMIIADGHHRAAMASAMGLKLDVQILDEKDLAPQLAFDKPSKKIGTPGVMPQSPSLQLPDELADHPLAPKVNKIMADAEFIEQDITPLLVGVADGAGGAMTGLDFRFKKSGEIDKKGEPGGVLGKILRKSEASKGKIAPEDVTINDALRYTATFEPENYVDGVRAIIKSLRDAGYEMPDDKIKNSWGQHDGYNGINATFVEPRTGMEVELQFHTPESWIAKGGDDGKQGTHTDYEVVRNMRRTPDERRAAFQRMVSIADSVRFPPNMTGLKDIGTTFTRPFKPGGAVEPPAAPLVDPIEPPAGGGVGTPALV